MAHRLLIVDDKYCQLLTAKKRPLADVFLSNVVHFVIMPSRGVFLCPFTSKRQPFAIINSKRLMWRPPSSTLYHGTLTFGSHVLCS